MASRFILQHLAIHDVSTSLNFAFLLGQGEGRLDTNGLVVTMLNDALTRLAHTSSD